MIGVKALILNRKIFINDISILLVSLTLNFIARIYRFDHPISLGWQFRYTQTAFTIKSLRVNGFNPFTAELPIFGSPWKVPMEFPVYQLFAALVANVFGLTTDYAGRLTATLFFLATSVVVYLLGKILFSREVSFVALQLFLWSSFGLDWGTAVLIDFTSVFFLASGLFFLLKFIEQSRSIWISFYAVAMALGSLTKVTTAFSWLLVGVPIVLWIFAASWRNIRLVCLTTFAAVVPTVFWNIWSDRVKADNPYAAFLTSRNMRRFNFGTLRQRLEMEQWSDLFERFTGAVVGYPLFAVILTMAAFALSPHPRKLLLLMAICASAPLIFFNLYGHDYYPIAIYPAFVIVVASGLVEAILFSKKNSSFIARYVLISLAAISVIGLSWVLPLSRERIFNIINSPPTMLYEEIRNGTNESDYLIVVGDDYSSAILYFADRRGLMLRPGSPPVPREQLGTTYRFVYWHNQEDFNWERYFPTDLNYRWVSKHLIEIIP